MGSCKKCKQIVTQKCDETICEYVIPANCITGIEALSCVKTAKGAKLNDVLKALDDKICACDCESGGEYERLYLKLGELDYTTLNDVTDPATYALINGNPLPANAIITGFFYRVNNAFVGGENVATINSYVGETTGVIQIDAVDSDILDLTNDGGVYYGRANFGEMNIVSENIEVDVNFGENENQHGFTAGNVSIVVEYYIVGTLPF